MFASRASGLPLLAAVAVLMVVGGCQRAAHDFPPSEPRAADGRLQVLAWTGEAGTRAARDRPSIYALVPCGPAVELPPTPPVYIDPGNDPRDSVSVTTAGHTLRVPRTSVRVRTRVALHEDRDGKRLVVKVRARDAAVDTAVALGPARLTIDVAQCQNVNADIHRYQVIRLPDGWPGDALDTEANDAARTVTARPGQFSRFAVGIN